jgi:hypothetical protein
MCGQRVGVSTIMQFDYDDRGRPTEGSIVMRSNGAFRFIRPLCLGAKARIDSKVR